MMAWRKWGCVTKTLPDSIGDPGNELAAKTVLEAVEDLLSAITDDFTQPDVGIHADKQRPLVQTGWLRMRHNDGVEQIVPDLNHFGVGPALVHAQILQDRWHHVVGGLRAKRSGDFLRG